MWHLNRLFVAGLSLAWVVGCSSNDGGVEGAGSSNGVGSSQGSGSGGINTNGGAGANLGGAGANLGGAGQVGGAGGINSSSNSSLGGLGNLGGATGLAGAAATTGGSTSGCGTAAVCVGMACGTITDPCGNSIDCGYTLCPAARCGTTTAGVCDPCVPATDCTALGANCGPISDGCGGLLNCGTCPTGQICGVDTANVCGDSTTNPSGQPCVPPTNFCLMQDHTNCAATALTSISGTVYAPNGTLPLPNAMIYIPNESMTSPYGLSVFEDGVANGSACECNVQGNPLVSTVSKTDGSFVLTDVPVGSNIPVVIQLGRWRRVITVNITNACTNTVIPATQTRLARSQAEGHPMDAIPLMAVATGDVDALECVLRKTGVADNQFSNAGGTGRIRFYQDNGAIFNNTTPPITQLTTTQAEIDQYDAVIFPCRANAHDITPARKRVVLDAPTNANSYTNKGGRAFFTHFSYSWLYRNDAEPSWQLPWPSVTATNSVNTQWTTAYGQIDTTFPRGKVFAEWLGLPAVAALTPIAAQAGVPFITINDVRRDMQNPATWPIYNGVTLPALRWIYHTANIRPPDGSAYNPSDAIQHVSFDMPWDQPPEKQCGRVLYSSFHVTGASTNGVTFPRECTATFSAQEKILAYFMFDMTSCVQPPKKVCVPKTCADQAIFCGQAGDGCGGVLDCGTCTNCQPLSCETACANKGQTCVTTYDAAVWALSCPQQDSCGKEIPCFCKIG